MTHEPRPRITDDEVARLPVQAGLDALLSGIVDDVAPRRRRAWPVAVAAAAAVVATIAVPAYLLRDHDGAQLAQPAATTSVPATSGPTVPAQAPGPTRTSEPAPAVTVETATWQDPPTSYAVLDAPGWTVESVSTTASHGVDVGYHEGRRYFSVSLVRARWWDGLYRDNTRDETLSPITVLGRDAVWLTEPSQQQFAFLPVRDGYGLRLDASFTTPDEFVQLLGQLREVDAKGFVDALPADVVGPGKAHDVETQMLDGADLPDHLTVGAVVGYNTRYGVANTVIRDLGCAWAQQWVRAKDAGDAAGQRAVERALERSGGWPVVADDLRSQDWFADTLQLMRAGKDAYVLTSAGCDLNKLDLAYDTRTGTLKQALPTLPDTVLTPQDGVR